MAEKIYDFCYFSKYKKYCHLCVPFPNPSLPPSIYFDCKFLKKLPVHLIVPSGFFTAVLSDLHWQIPSIQTVSNNICSHCSLKKHSSSTRLAESQTKHKRKYFNIFACLCKQINLEHLLHCLYLLNYIHIRAFNSQRYYFAPLADSASPISIQTLLLSTSC